MFPAALASASSDFISISVPPLVYVTRSSSVNYQVRASSSASWESANSPSGNYPVVDGVIPIVAAYGSGYGRAQRYFGSAAQEYISFAVSLPAGTYRLLGAASFGYSYRLLDVGGAYTSGTQSSLYWSLPLSAASVYIGGITVPFTAAGSLWVIDRTITIGDTRTIQFNFSVPASTSSALESGASTYFCMDFSPVLSLFPVSGGAVSPDYTAKLDAILAELKKLESGQSSGLSGIQQILTPTPSQSQHAQDVQDAMESHQQAIDDANEVIESAAPRPEPSAAAPPPVSDFVDVSDPGVVGLQDGLSVIFGADSLLPVWLLMIALATAGYVLFGRHA